MFYYAMMKIFFPKAMWIHWKYVNLQSAMIIKVCGLREPNNIRAIELLGVGMIGYDCRPQSPYFIEMIPSGAGIIPDFTPSEIKRTELPPAPEHRPDRIGVFADDMPQSIVTRVVKYQLAGVQLNGSESPVMIDNLRRTLIPDICSEIRIIKKLVITSKEDFAQFHEYVGHADMFLFDVKANNGEKADWSLLDAYDGEIPFLIGGEIGPDDVERIKAFCHPQFVGVDVNERFDKETAIKDLDLLKDFLSAIE